MNKKSISIFIPHLGCPCRCTFCNQRAISGRVTLPTDGDIEAAVKTAVLFTAPEELEIAFFGGSFTMIARETMLHYLDLAKSLCERYKLHGIRFSTRPDGINEETVKIIEKYPVTAVELGVQSMDDGVLVAAKRGHTAADTANAAALLKSTGVEIVLQMMVGMEKSTESDVQKTAETLAALEPQAVRIYPVLVLKGTELESRCLSGKYTPLTVEQAVEITVKLIKFFTEKGIAVIKVGLQAEEDFDSGKSLVAGPYHQAFRELCEGRIFLEKILAQYKGGNAVVLCNQTELSKVKGHRRENEEKLAKAFPNARFSFKTDESVKKGEIKIVKGA